MESRTEPTGDLPQRRNESQIGEEPAREADPDRVMVAEDAEVQTPEVSSTPNQDLDVKHTLISSTALAVAVVLILAVVLIAAIA